VAANLDEVARSHALLRTKPAHQRRDRALRVPLTM